MARTKSSTSIKAEIAKLREQLESAEGKEAERLGTLAMKAGLHEVEASDADLISAMKEIAGRFLPTADKHDAATAPSTQQDRTDAETFTAGGTQA
jgi:hypothetical protein